MTRKLKTYQTSLGFFDLTIAAPSMKAALQAWGAGSNLFHQGIARETDDPDVVAAALSKPGVVLKRPAGSTGRFTEQAELPSELGDKGSYAKRRSRPKQRASPGPSDQTARKAASNLERDQRRYEAERRREEAARARQRVRRQTRIAKAQAAFDQARRQHEAKAGAIEAERAAVEKRAGDEEARWGKQRKKLEEAERRARED